MTLPAPPAPTSSSTVVTRAPPTSITSAGPELAAVAGIVGVRTRRASRTGGGRADDVR